MDFPAPGDPKAAPTWENYVVAQAAAASLRLVPSSAHALGVEVDGTRVTLVLQAPNTSPEAEQDVTEIVSELEALLGPDVNVFDRLDRQAACRLSPHDGVAWFFATRA